MKTDNTKFTVPMGSELKAILNLGTEISLDKFISSSLSAPLDDFFARPRKNFRGTLVEMGFLLSGASRRLADVTPQNHELVLGCGEILEVLHAGSLIVDDIEDNSRVRRGQATLHKKYGLPIALNSANWLYFWPFQMVRQMGFSAALELEVYQLIHGTLLRAHFGQALDIGVSIDLVEREKVPALCLSAIELKTGALTALALTLGGLLGGADPARLVILKEFGHQIGIALQMWDDFGSLSSRQDLPYPYSKKYEDFILRRPSFTWAAAAELCDDRSYRDFIFAVSRLPDESFLAPWLAHHDFLPRAKKRVEEFTARAFHELEAKLGPHHETGLEEARMLGRHLTESYV